jgi:5-deoxy-glucuronate isomerase
MRSTEDLLLRSVDPGPSGTEIHVTPEHAGWKFVSLRVEKLAGGDRYAFETGGDEVCIVPLRGEVTASVGEESYTLTRPGTMFDGKPSALYVPIAMEVLIETASDAEIAIAGSRAERSFPVQFIGPDDIDVEIRGAGNATRQISHIIKPEFAADNLLVVEVFTPSGNWSSYPPHKHDIDNMPHESNLEEIYYYRIDGPEGFGLQRLYTDAGFDAAWVIRDKDLLLVHEGYHAFAIAHGYTGYYLNVLAGPADYRTMQPIDDPTYAWVRDTWDDAMNDGVAGWQDIDDRINGEAGKRMPDVEGSER